MTVSQGVGRPPVTGRYRGREKTPQTLNSYSTWPWPFLLKEKTSGRPWFVNEWKSHSRSMMREAGPVYLRHQADSPWLLTGAVDVRRAMTCESSMDTSLCCLDEHFGRKLRYLGLLHQVLDLLASSVAISTGHMARSSLVNQWVDRVQECTRQKRGPRVVE